MSAASRANPDIAFEVLIHKVKSNIQTSFKVDGLSDEHKTETRQDIQQRILDELADVPVPIHISFYLTSIYDYTVHEAFSKILQKLIPQLPTLENLLNILCSVKSLFLIHYFKELWY